MNRRMFGAVMVIALLLPGVWLTDGLAIAIPAGVPAGAELPDEVRISELLFTAIPALFIVAMVVEAMGHIRERKPPS